MRYIPTLCLREGMIVGKNIYGNNGQLLLTKGTSIKNIHIEAIKKKGFSGIYIKDALSSDIEIEGIVSDNLRQRTVKGLKDVFIAIDSNGKDKFNKMEDLKYQVEDIIDEILNYNSLMVNMVDLKYFDDYTYQHSVNVAVLSIILGVALRFNRKKLYMLGIGALLHDIGKVFIDKEILNKPGKLTDEEFTIMKSHVVYGYDYLKKEFDFPVQSFMGALDHHEKYDGTGYPNKKAADKISLFGRIISIADVYDALTSERPYRSAMLPSEATEYLMGGAGSSFDYDLIKLFVRKVAPYPLGTCVCLSNAHKGIVIQNYEDACLRPKIRIFEVDGHEVEPFILDLRNDEKYLNTTIELIVRS